MWSRFADRQMEKDADREQALDDVVSRRDLLVAGGIAGLTAFLFGNSASAHEPDGAKMVLDKNGKPVKRIMKSGNVTQIETLGKNGEIVDRKRILEQYIPGQNHDQSVGNQVRGWTRPKQTWWREAPKQLSHYDTGEFYFQSGKQYQKDKVTNVGDRNFQMDSFDRAVGYFRAHIEKHTRDAKAWNRLGDSYQLLKKFNKAIKAYEKAVDFDSMDGNAWLGLGASQYHVGKFTSSKQSMETALRIGDRKTKKTAKDYMVWASNNGKY